MCQTAMLYWESAAALHIALARLKFLWFLLFSPLKFLSYVSNLHFQSARRSKEGICSREKHFCSPWFKIHIILFCKCCVVRLQTESLCLFFLKIFERILFIWAIRHPASGYVQGINDLVTPFFVVYVFEYIGKLFLLHFVCDALPMWQFTFFFYFFFSPLQDLLLIEHFYTRHDFRAEGSWQQAPENEPHDPLRLCFLPSWISLPFCSLSCFFHLSGLISVRSGSFKPDLCLIVLWNTIHPSLIRLWEPGLETPHRPRSWVFLLVFSHSFFSLLYFLTIGKSGQPAKLTKNPRRKLGKSS